MKLLFDENLSPRLANSLGDLFPGSTGVLLAGLGGATDNEIWNYAAKEGFVFVSKDADFHRLSTVLGPPPKVVWIAIGNSSVTAVSRLIRERYDVIVDFEADPDAAFLALS